MLRIALVMLNLTPCQRRRHGSRDTRVIRIYTAVVEVSVQQVVPEPCFAQSVTDNQTYDTKR